MDSVALERIAFQIKSPLATKIIAACQDAMDELKSTRRPDDSGNIIANYNRMKRATKALRKSFAPKLIEICKDELNLGVEVQFEDYVAYLNAATYTEYKKYSGGDGWMTIVQGYNLFEGTSDNVPDNYDREYFKKTADNVDLQAGKLKVFSKEHVTHLWLLTSSFMSEEIIDPAAVSPVTAEELAAVILHELGHAMTIIEHMADLYHRSDVVTNTITYLNEKADEKVLSEVVSDAKENEDKLTTEAKKATDILSKIKGSISNLDPVIAIVGGIYLFLTVVAPIYLRIIMAGKYSTVNSRYNKTSDTVVTQSNESYMERIADEFVSRQGLGAALAVALSKMARYGELGHQYDSFSESVKAIGTVRTILMSVLIVGYLIYPIMDADDGTYDPDWLRLEHILQNNMVVFKDDKLDPETRDYFLKETKILIDVVDKFKNRKLYKIRQLIWGTIFRILSRTSIVDSFSTAGLSADYDKLQLLTNGLIKNKLFYQAARLKKIQ